MNKTLKLISAEDHVDDGAPTVLQLANDADPQAIEVCLADVERIDLNFPKFTDGRAYSQAFLLRRRLGFKGEIRAVGDFLYDQIAYQKRVGFDAWEVPQGFTLEQFRRALTEMTNVYQPSADGKKTIRQLRAGT